MAYNKEQAELIVAKFNKSGLSLREGAKVFGVSRHSLKQWTDGELPKCNGNQEVDDPDLLSENVRLAKERQKYQDKNRIQNKSFREHARVENALEEYNKALITTFSSHALSITTTHHVEADERHVGIIQFSDLHFNELVELEHNQYDFTIAGKRLYAHVERSLRYFNATGVDHVVMAFTADLMNSDRRLDELLATADNRSRATFLAVDILKQAIEHVNKHYNVTVSWVNGNEGRVGKDIGFTSKTATDNYDETIMRTLQYLFLGKPGVTFYSPNNGLEAVLNICGHNILLIHGHTLGRNYQASIANVMAKYSSRNIKLRYVLFGHIHEAYISENFARSGSPVGDNAYSDKGLQLSGRASQNCYVVHHNGNIDGMKIDLQEYGENGYATNPELHSYNTRSANKEQAEILKIVI